MKAVKDVKTGEIKYRQDPEFNTGLGIRNVIQLFGEGLEDYEEVDISQEEWDTYIKDVDRIM